MNVAPETPQIIQDQQVAPPIITTIPEPVELDPITIPEPVVIPEPTEPLPPAPEPEPIEPISQPVKKYKTPKNPLTRSGFLF